MNSEPEVQVTKAKRVWVAWGPLNGVVVPLVVTDVRKTAVRLGRGQGVLVNGKRRDAEVKPGVAVLVGNQWLGPVAIVAPSAEDAAANEAEERYQEAYDAAVAAGLSSDLIEALRRGKG